ncbi:MAG: hypothetical protein E6J42_06630 [Chloroflexi bacterium]|nr:MAG: hypothetical protein E6J42_06630 [Chloroflexota bacterium]
MGELRLLLLGGATASGKTTSGTAIAARLDASCVSADAIWQALRAATTRESHPAFHYFEPSEDEWRRGPDFLCARHIECAETMSPPLDAAIDFELHQRHPLVFEGAWITPEMAARRVQMSAQTRAVFIYEPEESEILASMVRRQNRDSPSERQVKLAAMAWRYGNWLREGAEKHGLPIVRARPRDTLVERIVDAIALQTTNSCSGRSK